MDPIRTLTYCRSLVRALELTPEGRPAWLGAILTAVRETAGPAVVYLAEAGAAGWQRTVCAGGRLHVRPEEVRLGGLSRRMAAGLPSHLEPRIVRGSRFRKATDGWTDCAAAAYAAVAIPRVSDRAWLAVLFGHEAPAPGPEILRILEPAAEAVAVGLAHERRWAELEELAMTDGLTHIPNYRFLRLAVEREIARCRRTAEFFTVVMVDVDNLKLYNAAHGHLAGSEVLSVLAGLLRNNVRRTDIAGKYGGDEFVLLLPRTRPTGGRILSERIRQKIAEALRGRAGEVISCSFGVAGFPEDGEDFESLMQAADRALFTAKQEGRNAVVCVARDVGGSGLGSGPSRTADAAVGAADHRTDIGNRGDRRSEPARRRRAA